MPNAFAYIALMTWPLVALVMFRTMSLERAVIWTILGGYLVLPSATSINMPLIPALDKEIVSTLSALFLAMAYSRNASAVPVVTVVQGRQRARSAIYIILIVILGSPFLTVMQNTEPRVTGILTIQGLRLYDAFSMMFAVAFFILPFFIGWRYLGTRAAHALLLKAMVVAGLIYSVPVLLEVRLSPQLHTWIYGFFPHGFDQHMRGGWFRPVVFLTHGLLIGMLYSLALLAALVLWREALRIGKTSSGWIFAIVWLAALLILSQNFGALAITICLGLLVTFAGRRVQVMVAVTVACIVLLYPMLRGAGLVPVTAAYELAERINPERADSLKFRLDNEDALLDHANEKPMFGWGSWARNQLFDPYTGQMTSITDGFWIILIGIYGWVGYIAQFSLLTLPILLYARRRKVFGPTLITPGLMIMLSAALVDLLPNAGLVAYVWLIAGSLTGLVLRNPASDNAEAMELDEPEAGASKAAPAWLAAPAPARSRRRVRGQRSEG